MQTKSTYFIAYLLCGDICFVEFGDKFVDTASDVYDRVLDRIYVGTGNSQYGPGWTGTTAPDKWYGSGCISLDATTGRFRGFHLSGDLAVRLPVGLRCCA